MYYTFDALRFLNIFFFILLQESSFTFRREVLLLCSLFDKPLLLRVKFPSSKLLFFLIWAFNLGHRVVLGANASLSFQYLERTNQVFLGPFWQLCSFL